MSAYYAKLFPAWTTNYENPLYSDTLVKRYSLDGKCLANFGYDTDDHLKYLISLNPASAESFMHNKHIRSTS